MESEIINPHLSSLNNSSGPHLPVLAPPVDDWCFDMMLYYYSAGEDDAQAQKMLKSLESYSTFSFAVNGLLTGLLVMFGLAGNVMFIAQLHGSRHFSRRLAAHLSMLCVWDMALLMCCLLAYGVISTVYGIIPFVGLVAYLLYVFQPFASFCVTGSIWQVLVITVERYAAVSKPLEQRSRNAQFPPALILLFIALGAFLLNMVVVPLERRLTDCYEFTQDGSFRIRTMIVQRELANNQYYAIRTAIVEWFLMRQCNGIIPLVVHLIPDIIFRAPMPIIAIAYLTVRTLQICRNRSSGQVGQGRSHRTSGRKSVPFMLTLLNLKFILCNTLYVFNTVLMEIVGYGGQSSAGQQSELEMEQYVSSLYLTDFSNILLAVHSATNWLIFYRWSPLLSWKRKVLAQDKGVGTAVNSYRQIPLKSLSSLPSSARKASASMQPQQLSRVPVRKVRTFTAESEVIDRLLAMAESLGGVVLVRNVLTRASPHSTFAAQRLLSTGDDLCIGAFATTAVKLLHKLREQYYQPMLGASNTGWSDIARNMGRENAKLVLGCSLEDWKALRNAVIDALCEVEGSEPPPFEDCGRRTDERRTVQRLFNLIMREIRIGAFCETVDHK